MKKQKTYRKHNFKKKIKDRANKHNLKKNCKHATKQDFNKIQKKNYKTSKLFKKHQIQMR